MIYEKFGGKHQYFITLKPPGLKERNMLRMPGWTVLSLEKMLKDLIHSGMI